MADRHQSAAGLALHTRTGRQAGLTLDEVALAREGDSRDEREATLLRYLRPLIDGPTQPAMHLHEEAREAGWSDEQLLEAISQVAIETYTAMINLAGDVPADATPERAATLRAA